MPFYVYILHSASTDRFYRGQSANIKNRLIRHNRGTEASTAHGVPWELLWKTEKESRSEAVILEQKLKKLNRSRLIKFMYSNLEDAASLSAAATIQSLSDEA